MHRTSWTAGHLSSHLPVLSHSHSHSHGFWEDLTDTIRDRMVWVLLLVVLTASVCGMFAERKTPTVYQAEEDDTITVKLDSHDQTDLSLANMICLLQSRPLKVLYQMIDGAELPESQDQQFVGRVLCDGDALRRGRVRLHVSRVTAEDSGDYRCDLVADYDRKERRWRLKTTEYFAVKVAQSSDGENSDVSPNLAAPQGANPSPRGPQRDITAPIFLVTLIFAALIWANWTSLRGLLHGIRRMIQRCRMTRGFEISGPAEQVTSHPTNCSRCECSVDCGT